MVAERHRLCSLTSFGRVNATTKGKRVPLCKAPTYEDVSSVERQFQDLKKQIQLLRDEQTRMWTIQQMQGKMDEMRRFYIGIIITLAVALTAILAYLV